MALTTDQVRMLECHAIRYPDSEIIQAVNRWYNAEYAALGEIEPYEVCPPSEAPSTLEDVIDLISAFTQGKSRRVARAAIRIICRQARRNNAERTAPNAP